MNYSSELARDIEGGNDYYGGLSGLAIGGIIAGVVVIIILLVVGGFFALRSTSNNNGNRVVNRGNNRVVNNGGNTSPLSQFRANPNMSIPYGNIECYEDSNDVDCARKCLADPNCVSFDIGHANGSKEGKCCIQDTTSGAVASNDYNYYVKV